MDQIPLPEPERSHFVSRGIELLGKLFQRRQRELPADFPEPIGVEAAYPPTFAEAMNYPPHGRETSYATV